MTHPITPLDIVVLLGGPSAEREVSLRSGEAVAAALKTLGHRVRTLDPDRSEWKIDPPVDLAFLALHGEYGEDGQVQSRLESLGIPYTGSGVEASRLAMDKVATKKRLLTGGAATPAWAVYDHVTDFPPTDLPGPWVLKPATQGSSVGLHFVEYAADWSGALTQVLQVDDTALVEQRILGRELTVAVLGGKALPPVEIKPHGGCYDYHHKYTPGATEYLCPASLDEATALKLEEAALLAFSLVDCRDYARVDFMMPPHGDPLVLEINTLPGMTETSLFPKAAAAAGMSYATLCQNMIDLARRREVSSLSAAYA